MSSKQTLSLVIMFSLVPLGPMAIDIYLPSMAEMTSIFNVSERSMQQTISVYILALGVSQLFAGAFSDKYGRKVSAIWGLLTYAFGSMLVIFASSIMHLYFARAFQGLGAAMTMVTSMAWVRDHYDGITAGKWLSYMSGVTGAIPTIAPLLGTGLAFYWGWQGGFYAMALFALFIAIAAVLILKQEKPIVKSMNVESIKVLNCGLKEILTNRQFIIYTLANTVSFGGVLTYIAISPIFAINENGISAFSFSMLFGALGFSQMITSFLAPALMNKRGRKNTVQIGLYLIIAGGIGLSLIDKSALIEFFMLAALGNIGFSLIVGAAVSISLEPFKHCAGLATSISGFARMVGGGTVAVIALSLSLSSPEKLSFSLLLSTLSLAGVMLDKASKQKRHGLAK